MEWSVFVLAIWNYFSYFNFFLIFFFLTRDVIEVKNFLFTELQEDVNCFHCLTCLHFFRSPRTVVIATNVVLRISLLWGVWLSHTLSDYLHRTQSQSLFTLLPWPTIRFIINTFFSREKTRRFRLALIVDRSERQFLKRL